MGLFVLCNFVMPLVRGSWEFGITFAWAHSAFAASFTGLLPGLYLETPMQFLFLVMTYFLIVEVVIILPQNDIT